MFSWWFGCPGRDVFSHVVGCGCCGLPYMLGTVVNSPESHFGHDRANNDSVFVFLFKLWQLGNCLSAMVSLRTMLAWLVCWKPVKPSCVGLFFMSPWLCISLQLTLIPEESCPARGWQCVERLMRTLAYGWVERCSDIAGCGWSIHQQISAAVYIYIYWFQFNEL